MCMNEETIVVPRGEVKDMLGLGATCGACDQPGECCPDTPVVDGKIDMCLNENTINVSVNACKGIKTAGGTCGPCPDEVEVDPEIDPEPPPDE